MTQRRKFVTAHSKNFTVVISLRSTTSLIHVTNFKDVERSRNVNQQELYLVEIQKESVLRVKIPVVERSRNDHSIVSSGLRSTTSLIHVTNFKDVERSRNFNQQELYLVEIQKESVLRVILPVVERSRNDHSIVSSGLRSTTLLNHVTNFKDIERSRNFNQQELYLVEIQKESVLRVKIPVVERSRNEHSIVSSGLRSTTSLIHVTNFKDVERSRNVNEQEAVSIGGSKRICSPSKNPGR